MDERKEERKKKRMFLKVDENKGILVDISRIGLRVAMEKIPSGETVEISLKVKNRTLNLKGIIHWVEIKQTIDEAYEMGISLLDPNEDYREFVENLPRD